MDGERTAFGVSRRRAIVTALVAIVVVAGAVGLIGRIASFPVMLRALERAHQVWFPVCLGGEILAYVGYIAAYRDLARVEGGPRLPLWTVTRVVAVGFGAFVVGSSAGTLGVDYWALHKAGEDTHRAARRVLAMNTLQWGVLAAAATVAAALLLAGLGSGAPLSMELSWIVVVPSCVVAAAWVSAPRRAARLSALPAGQARRITRSAHSWLPGLLGLGRVAFADAIGGVILVRHAVLRPRTYPYAVLGFPVFWAGDVLTMYAALRAFDVHVGIAPLVLAYTTAYVVTSLPLPAGGAGGVEAGLAFSLEAVGVPLAPALLATLVYRFFTLWLPIGVAMLALPQVDDLAAELPRVEREPLPG